MSSNEKNNSLALTVVVLLVILAATITAWIILNSGNNQFIASDEGLIAAEKEKYGASSKRTQQLINNYKSELFQNDFFKRMKSFISLPLSLGQMGRSNPFEPPIVPEDL